VIKALRINKWSGCKALGGASETGLLQNGVDRRVAPLADNRAGPMFLEQTVQESAVGDIALDE
jgi:hypothetical protein